MESVFFIFTIMENVEKFRRVLINKFSHTTIILALIFCGAIVGENISLSLIVATFGSSIISKLYLVNGLLLFSLPILFFKKIDDVNRGQLLSKLLLICASALFIILIFILISERFSINISWILVGLYPFSYLSKTILFLTFWTFANDVFPTGEAKKKFPLIAAWGIGGGICGSSIAFFLVKAFPTVMLIALWGTAFLIAWFFSGNIHTRYEKQLKSHEDFRKKSLFDKSTGDRHPSFRLLILMASQYYLIFLAIFSLDYIFWNRSQRWFTTSEAIASFQFMFYLIHASVTVIGLRLLLPKMIEGIGFTKIFYFLPVTLTAGGIGIVILLYLFPDSSLFIGFTSVQFLRYIVFENAYAPIYQMYFAAIEREKRGRAKTLIEGVVKPGAILSSGIIIMLMNNNTTFILTITVVSGCLALINAYYIRRMYAMALVPVTYKHLEPQVVIDEFIGGSDRATMAVISQYADSTDKDMRLLAVKLLASTGTQQAFEELMRLYKKEDVQSVKELIARSISGFYNYSSKNLIEELLAEQNQRIRANTLYSLNRMHCNWKRHLRPLVRKLLFENSVRVQIEAACYLWENGDQHSF
ncbi:MAG TPA: HEAT repeat domain-containing protein [Chitinispirillaceae bacterium]|nr:HEAT repeat domain-containing protein [Chitinispirillaceae bacterium]